MRKIAICGDVHWSTYSSIIRKRGRKYSQRLEGLIKSLNWFEKLSKDQGCESEIFLGDTFDRPDLNAEEVTALQDIKWNKLPKHFIIGNHESNIGTLEYSSTKFFESIGANVISDPTTLEINDAIDFNLIPFIKTDKVLSINDYIKNKSKKNIFFAHQDLAGIQYGRYISQSGFSIDDIEKNCTLFFDGHLHNEQIINNNIILVGILSGQNFNEDAFKYEHLVYILTIDDDNSISIESFVNPEAFNFYRIKVENENDLVKLDNLKKHSVVSVVCEEKLISKVSKLIKSHKNIVESRLTLFYNYEYDSEGSTQTILVDDYTKQFIILAQEKLAKSSVLDSELALLGGD